MTCRTILFLLISALLASCSIDETTTFNSDFSGKTITKIDMTAMIELMGAMNPSDSSKSQFNKGIKKGMESAKESQQDLTNMDMDYDTLTNSLNLTYTFKDIEHANSISDELRKNQQTMGGSTSTSVPYRWEKPGKVLVMPGFENMDQLKNSGQEAMLKGITYSLVRTFPKKIAKVSDSRLTISSDRKTLTFKGNAEDLLSKPMTEITVTFK